MASFSLSEFPLGGWAGGEPPPHLRVPRRTPQPALAAVEVPGGPPTEAVGHGTPGKATVAPLMPLLKVPPPPGGNCPVWCFAPPLPDGWVRPGLAHLAPKAP